MGEDAGSADKGHVVATTKWTVGGGFRSASEQAESSCWNETESLDHVFLIHIAPQPFLHSLANKSSSVSLEFSLLWHFTCSVIRNGSLDVDHCTGPIEIDVDAGLATISVAVGEQLPLSLFSD